MKIARATPEDINALCDLAFAVDAINAGSIPPAEGGEEDEWEHIGAGNLLNILHDDTPASLQKESLDICRRCLIRLLEIAESGHITRAAGNLEAVFLPSNRIIDLEADTLETHPSIDQGWADTARLDWLAKNDCALTENLGDEDGDRQDTPFAVIHVQEEHFEVLAAANNIRQAIDTAMQAQAAEAEAT